MNARPSLDFEASNRGLPRRGWGRGTLLDLMTLRIGDFDESDEMAL